MLVLILIIGLTIASIVALWLGEIIYYYFYPERRLENILNPSLNAAQASDGLAGNNGDSGILEPFALPGLKGLAGNGGLRGPSGEKNFSTGPTGIRGLVGLQGPYGSIGLTGEPGLPSNSIIPFIERTRSGVKNLPYRFDHGFTIDGVFYILSAFFIFEELTYFSFQNGLKNKKFKIRDSDLDVVDGDLRAKKIYSSIRVVIEKKTGTSSGNIADVSPPITQTSYLLRYNTDSFNDLPFQEEKDIEKNREFGLDFAIVPNNADNSFLNFLLYGFANYLCVFNIEPPNPDIIPRLEERYSSTPITFTDSPSFQIEAKGNVRKITKEVVPAPMGIIPVPVESIYLLSPRLANGRVIRKDSSNNKNLWVVEPFGRLQEALDTLSLANISKAFAFLEEDNNTVKEDLKKTKKDLIVETYKNNVDIQNNIRAVFKNDTSISSEDLQAIQANLVEAETNFETTRQTYENNINNENVLINAYALELITLLDLLNSPPIPSSTISSRLSNYTISFSTLSGYIANPLTTFTVTSTPPPIIEPLNTYSNVYDARRANLYSDADDVSIDNLVANIQGLIDDINNNMPGDTAYDNAVTSLDSLLIQSVTPGNVTTVVASLQNDLDAFTMAFSTYQTFIVSFNLNAGVNTSNLMGFLKQQITSYQQNIDEYKNNVFYTRATFKNIYLDYPSQNSSLSYPSILEGSTFFLEFVIKINIKSLENFSYHIYLLDIAERIVVDSNDSIKFLTFPPSKNDINEPGISSSDSKNFFSTPFEGEFIKYRIIIKDTSLEFKKVYGRRVILDFSKTKIFLDAFFSSSDYYDSTIEGAPADMGKIVDDIMNGNNFQTGDPLDSDVPADIQIVKDRLGPMTIDNAFEGSNVSFDFQPGEDDVDGWDFRAETSSFVVDNDTFLVGYQLPETAPMAPRPPKYQRVYGNRQRNGNYFFDVPVYGFEYP